MNITSPKIIKFTIPNPIFKKKEEKKFNKKYAQFSSLDALGSYNKAFVNLNFKGSNKKDGQIDKNEIKEIEERINNTFDKGEIFYFNDIVFSDDESIKNNQLSLIDSLLDEKIKKDAILKILTMSCSLYDDITIAQINFAKELASKKLHGEIIASILNVTQNLDDVKIHNDYVEFTNEMLKHFKPKKVLIALSGSKIKKEFFIEQKEFFSELNKTKIGFKNTSNILAYTYNENKKINANQIKLAKSLMKNNVESADISKILSYTNSSDLKLNTVQVDLINDILDKNLGERFISNLLNAIPLEDKKEKKLEKLKQAQNYLKDYEDKKLTKRQIEFLLKDNDELYDDILKLNKKTGLDVAATISLKAYYFPYLYKVDNINQISTENKKDFIDKLMKLYSGRVFISDETTKLFPLIPATATDYCEILPKLLQSLGVETKPLNDEEISSFNISLNSLSSLLNDLSDDEFNNLKITQSYSKDEFIKDVFELVKNLKPKQKQKVLDCFGFQLLKNDQGSKVADDESYSIIGYPIDLNIDEKLTKIKDKNVIKVALKVQKVVDKFIENNSINVNGINNKKAKIQNNLEEILKYLPEFRTTLDKKQHKTHDFDVFKHSLKVMQKIVQNPEYEKLNESDKKLLLLASLLHDITKIEGRRDPFHAKNSSMDSYYISKKFNLSKDEMVKLYSLIDYHEWFGHLNSCKPNSDEAFKCEESIAFDMQYDNLFEMAKIFTQADLKAVKKDDSFYDRFKEKFEEWVEYVSSDIQTIKSTQPFLPVTKFPSASRVNEAITEVKKDGSTNLKGIYKDKDGLIIIRFNEVENDTWEKIGFNKGVFSKGFTTKSGEKINTGNIHFFIHGLDSKKQLINFETFDLLNSDALLSVSYANNPETKAKFFRSQGVIINANAKYVYGGSPNDTMSGYSKKVSDFKQNWIYNGKRLEEREFISNLIKRNLGLSDREYIEFVEKNKNKSFDEIEPIEIREELIKTLASVKSRKRMGGREYNEMYLSNPEIMAVFVSPFRVSEKIEDTLEFVKNQKDFLREYAIEHNIPMVILGDA